MHFVRALQALPEERYYYCTFFVFIFHIGFGIQPGLFALMSVYRYVCMSSRVLGLLGKHGFMHLFMHPLCVDVTCVVLSDIGIIISVY